jgi:proteasome lid subunit RPN8/RPN11
MVAQARAELPNECCGLLAGRIEGDAIHVVERYPLVNVEGSSKRYRAERDELFQVHRSARQNGLEVVAVYHSHPTSTPVPSQTDLAQNDSALSGVFLIMSLEGAEPELRAWWLSDGDYRAAIWEMLD